MARSPERVPLTHYTKVKVQAAFAAENAKTRPEIARAIAARLPVFAPKLPPLRKIWMSEDPRQSLFDAAALGMTYFRLREHIDEDGAADDR